MKYTITPYVGFDKVTIGDERNSVRSSVGDYKEFRKTPSSKNTSDSFGDFHVYYAENNTVEAIEFFDCEIWVNEMKLPKKASLLPASFTFDGDGVYISRELGVSVYAPNGTVETVFAFTNGYWD